MSWVVYRWGSASTFYEYAEVIRETKELLLYKGYGGHERRIHKSHAIATLDTEKEAEILISRLKASTETRDHAVRQADDQHRERVARIIAEATQAKAEGKSP